MKMIKKYILGSESILANNDKSQEFKRCEASRLYEELI